MPRHIYSSPPVPLAAASSAVLRAPLTHRPPNLLPVEYEGLDLYQLAENYLTNHGNYVFHEPMGILVDGASVPRLAWSFCPPDGRHRRSAFIHDVHYARKTVPKKVADQMFYDMLVEDGVSKWRAGIMFRAVHYFGNPTNSILRWSEPLYPPVL
jgi:hypothetical protein